MSFIVISVSFVLSIFLTIAVGLPLYIALFFGLILFYIDGYHKGISHKDLITLMLKGLKTVKNLIIIFTLIGVLTAGWRMSNTISYFVYYGSVLVRPESFYFICFLLNLFMSMLLGSVNGTATTMGIVLFNLGQISGANPLITTGAILSGAMYGDRSSPVSSSQALVADLSQTDVRVNRKLMLKTSIVPLILTSIVFLLVSIFSQGISVDQSIIELIGNQIDINHISMTPALAIIILSIFGLNTKYLLLISGFISFGIGIFLYDYSLVETLKYLLLGVEEAGVDQMIEAMVVGGGIKSMANLIVNVSISAMFFGIFEKSKFLKPIDQVIDPLGSKYSMYTAIVVLSTIFSIVFCTQALVVMAIHDLFKNKIHNNYQLMLDIENTAIVIPALVPWNLAASTAITLYGVSGLSVLFNIFCLNLPIIYGFSRKRFKA